MKSIAENLIVLFDNDKVKFEKLLSDKCRQEFGGYYEDYTLYLLSDFSAIGIDDEWVNVYHHIDYNIKTGCNFIYEPIIEIYIGI